MAVGSYFSKILNAIIGNLGKYDFLGWLFANGTVKYIHKQGTGTAYTVPKGKKAYVLYAFAFNWPSTLANTNNICYARVTGAGNNMFLCFNWFYVDANGIPHQVINYYLNNIVELPEGSGIYVYGSGSAPYFNAVIIEVDK